MKSGARAAPDTVIVAVQVANVAVDIERVITVIAVRRAQPNILTNARASIPKHLPYIRISKIATSRYAQVVDYIFHA